MDFIAVGLLVIFLGLPILYRTWKFVERKLGYGNGRGSPFNYRKTIPEFWRGWLDRDDVLILDTETTGTGRDAEIVEIAVIDTTGRVLFDRPVMPTGDVPREAVDIHGLNRRTLASMKAKGWREYDRQLRELLQGATLVLAYNAEYDERLIDQSALAVGLFALRGHGVKWNCLMRDYAKWRGVPDPRGPGEYRWHKLADAYAREVGHADQRHRALADCRMSLGLMQAVAGQPLS